MSERQSTNGNLAVDGLRTDHARDPLGIDEKEPRFSWQLLTERRGVRQTASRVQVWSQPHSNQEEVVWDSGWVSGPEQLGVVYSGSPLVSHTRYTWQVSVRDNNGNEATSPEAWFETAFLSPEEWIAKWIGGVAMTSGMTAPLMRREFQIDGDVAKARVYICGLGYHELLINGRRVGDSVLDPAWTDYKARVLYTTLDVTSHIVRGQNALGVCLGNGWFESTPSSLPSQLQPQLLLELHVVYTDGRLVKVATSAAEEWMTTSEGPIRDHSIYGGETYDVRKEIPGWSEAGQRFHSTRARWSHVLPVEPPGGVLQAQAMEPIKVVDQLQPASILRLGPETQVIDFGQNLAGWVRLNLDGEAGTLVTVRHAELKNPDGTLNTLNLRTAKATDRYILDGRGPRQLEPHFTYHGFRYVQIEGYAPDLSTEDVVGQVVRSAVEEVGEFSCNDDLLNRIHRNVVWTEASNLHGVPTDCPQRDERLAWLNDMTVRAEQAVHNFGLARLYGKWFQDIVDTQGPVTGAISDTAPHIRIGRRPADPVVSSFLLVPLLLHQHYGEQRWIERHFDDLAKWVDYLASLRQDGIIEHSAIGDWAPPIGQAIEGSAGAGAQSAITPGGLISTGFLYMNLGLMETFSALLGRRGDADNYQRTATEVRAAINERYLDSKRAVYGPGNQASLAFALYLGIVPTWLEQRVVRHLVQDIEAQDYHLTTGNLCTKYVMDVLGRHGRADVALKILQQRTYPSWGYMIDKGATTIWERWEHVTDGPLSEMGSHNHPMYGSVDSWFYRFLGGIIPSSNEPGFGGLRIEPVMPQGLQTVDCRMRTPRGILRCSWSRTEDTVKIAVTIPPNALASVLVPVPPSWVIREGHAVVWDKGSPSRIVEGAKGAAADIHGVRFEIGSGDYTFSASRTEKQSRATPE